MNKKSEMSWDTLYDAIYPLFEDANPEDLDEYEDEEIPQVETVGRYTSMMLDTVNRHMNEVCNYYTVRRKKLEKIPTSKSLFGMPACHLQSYSVEKSQIDSDSYFDEVRELWILLDGTLMMTRCWQLSKGENITIARQIEWKVEYLDDICEESLDDLMYDLEDFVQMATYCDHSPDPLSIEYP